MVTRPTPSGGMDTRPTPSSGGVMDTRPTPGGAGGMDTRPSGGSGSSQQESRQAAVGANSKIKIEYLGSIPVDSKATDLRSLQVIQERLKVLPASQD